MPPWCKIQVYLLCRGKTCMKQVHISKRLKYIKWTTHWAQKILNFNLAENFSTMHGCHSFYNSQWYSLWQELSMGTNMLTLWLSLPWSLTYFLKTLTMRIIVEQCVLEFWYFTRVILVTSSWVRTFVTLDLDHDFALLFENFNLIDSEC